MNHSGMGVALPSHRDGGFFVDVDFASVANEAGGGGKACQTGANDRDFGS